jgi:hypothetical protein
MKGNLYEKRWNKKGTITEGTRRTAPSVDKPALRKMRAATKVSHGPKCRPSWKPIPKNCGRSMRWKETGGEPDVVGHDQKTGEYIFFRLFSGNSQRPHQCLLRPCTAWIRGRNINRKPAAMDYGTAMGIELLTEEQYQSCRNLGDFDTKTSSWVKTPADIRKLGGALYGIVATGRVFVGHNGAQSYYSARAFRGSIGSKIIMRAETSQLLFGVKEHRPIQ